MSPWRCWAMLAPLALCLSACAAFRPPVPAAWPLPDPALAPFQGQRAQSLRVARGRQSLELVAMLAHDGGTVTLAALSPLGQRLMKATWTAQGLSVEMDPAVAARFDAAGALRDLVFAAWPPASLQAALKESPWSARFLPDGSRELWCQGRLTLRVQGDPAAEGGQLLQHARDGYSITVKDLKDQDDPDQP